MAESEILQIFMIGGWLRNIVLIVTI